MTQVELWMCDLDCGSDRYRVLQGWLSPGERARAARFHKEQDRRSYRIRRGLLRKILATYTGQSPGDLDIAEHAGGKPFLRTGTNDLHFNLSHSRDVMLAGVCRQAPLGVDIEAFQPMHDEIAAAAMTVLEKSTLAAMPLIERDGYAMKLWTCKEAVLKAAGTGLATKPSSIEVTFDHDGAWGNVTTIANCDTPRQIASTVHSFGPREGYFAALAVGAGPTVTPVHVVHRRF